MKKKDIKIGKCLDRVLRTRRGDSSMTEIWDMLEFLAEEIDKSYTKKNLPSVLQIRGR